MNVEKTSFNQNKRSGRIVETKKGLIGFTYNHQGLINGKVRVHVATCTFLCKPETLIIKGFID